MNARIEAEAVSLPVATTKDKVVSVFMWLIALVWLIPMLALLMVLHWLLPNRIMDVLDRIYIWGQIKLLMGRIRYETHPEVDPNTQYMFMQNHTNHFDHVMMYLGSPHINGWFMKARGTIPVLKGKGGQTPEIMQTMREVIGRGQSILAFPEGTRSLTGRLSPFRRGTFFIARELGLPIVPVTVTGSYEVMRKGSLVIRPGIQLTVIYDKPVETKDRSDEDLAQVMDEVQRVMGGQLDRYWSQRGLL